MALIVGLSVLGSLRRHLGRHEDAEEEHPCAGGFEASPAWHPRTTDPVRGIVHGARIALHEFDDVASEADAFPAKRQTQAVASVKAYGQLQNRAPAKGSQYVLVSFALKYVGGGSAEARDIKNQLALIGKHGVPYTALDNSCAAPHDIPEDKPVYSGEGTQLERSPFGERYKTGVQNDRDRPDGGSVGDTETARLERRGWDSNPGTRLPRQRFSRPPRSAAPAPRRGAHSSRVQRTRRAGYLVTRAGAP